VRLEQTVTVRLGPADVSQLKTRHSLTVACACGQHITLAWDDKATDDSLAARSRMIRAARVRRQRAEAREQRLMAEMDRRVAARREKQPPREVPFRCRRCKRVFGSNLALRVHVQRAHEGVGPQKDQKPKKATPKKAAPKKATPRPPATPVGKAAKHFCSVEGCSHAPFTTVQGAVMHRRRVHEGFNPLRARVATA
jgi:uncharacterized C2H2 Zn-finger protein